MTVKLRANGSVYHTRTVAVCFSAYKHRRFSGNKLYARLMMRNICTVKRSPSEIKTAFAIEIPIVVMRFTVEPGKYFARPVAVVIYVSDCDYRHIVHIKPAFAADSHKTMRIESYCRSAVYVAFRHIYRSCRTALLNGIARSAESGSGFIDQSVYTCTVRRRYIVRVVPYLQSVNRGNRIDIRAARVSFVMRLRKRARRHCRYRSRRKYRAGQYGCKRLMRAFAFFCPFFHKNLRRNSQNN